MRLFDKEEAPVTKTHTSLQGRKDFMILYLNTVQRTIVLVTNTDPSGAIERNKEIGTIDSWGPVFRISFDLIIHSYVKGKGKQGWSSVLAFEKRTYDYNGEMKSVQKIPTVDFNKKGELRIFFQKRKYTFNSNVDLNKWYNITIEQKMKFKKVSRILFESNVTNCNQ